MNNQYIKPENTEPLDNLPSDFNWETYIELNEDVRNVYPSQETATQHYLYEGHIQNRRYIMKNIPEDFNWITYVVINTDVYNVCKTRISAMTHYDIHGFNENRRYTFIAGESPPDFDWEIYKKLNPSISPEIVNEIDARIHYNTIGKHNDIQYKYSYDHAAPPDFDWEIYKNLNPSISPEIVNENDAIIHYNTIGKHDDLRYKYSYELIAPPDFNWEIYKNLNPSISPDIVKEKDAIIHYNTIGKHNDLQYKKTYNAIPHDFDWEVYCELNLDVKRLCPTEQLAKMHYVTDGYLQNRRYCIPKESIPPDFNWEIYVELNPDIKEIYNSEILSKLHYYITGKNEDRIYKFNHTPNNFNWVIYCELNDDYVPAQYKMSEIKAKLHYELFGRHQTLKYNDIFELVPSDFDWEKYVILNPDISDLCKTEIKTKMHYEQFGAFQSRKYIQENNQSKNNTKYNNHPYLFHKYILGVSKPTNTMKYSQINNFINTQKYVYHNMVAHLHCYNIDLFNKYYSNYMNTISNNCTIILVTFCIGDEQNFPTYNNNNIILIKSANVGMDIGGKYVCINYFKKNNIKYKYILFLHSKYDDGMRKAYWEPLLLNMSMIKREIINDSRIGIFVPPLIYTGDYANIIYKDNFVDINHVTSKWNSGNILYMNDLDNYFGFNPKNFFFPEGNCFVCNNEIAEMLYGDIINYNLLNTNVSFDAVWVKSLYGGRMSKDVGNTINEIFSFFRSYRSKERIWPNNIAMGIGHNGHADNMYEHSYERIVFKVVQKLGYKIKIMPWIKTSEYMNKLDAYNQKINAILNV